MKSLAAITWERSSVCVELAGMLTASAMLLVIPAVPPLGTMRMLTVAASAVTLAMTICLTTVVVAAGDVIINETTLVAAPQAESLPQPS